MVQWRVSCDVVGQRDDARKSDICVIFEKKMNLFDTEVFDFDVLMEILKNKPNLFFPS